MNLWGLALFPHFIEYWCLDVFWQCMTCMFSILQGSFASIINCNKNICWWVRSQFQLCTPDVNLWCFKLVKLKELQHLSLTLIFRSCLLKTNFLFVLSHLKVLDLIAEFSKRYDCRTFTIVSKEWQTLHLSWRCDVQWEPKWDFVLSFTQEFYSNFRNQRE